MGLREIIGLVADFMDYRAGLSQNQQLSLYKSVAKQAQSERSETARLLRETRQERDYYAEVLQEHKIYVVYPPECDPQDEQGL
jgi:hypothetical protein